MTLNKKLFISINLANHLCLLPIALVALLSVLGCGKSESEKANEKADLEARIVTCKTTITQIEQAVQIYAMRHSKKLPSVIEDLTNGTDDNPGLLKKESIIDIWGTPYAYSPSGNSFKITSAGPDRRLGTKDDITN